MLFESRERTLCKKDKVRKKIGEILPIFAVATREGRVD